MGGRPVAEEIHRWRDEAGIEKRCDPEELRSAIQGIREPGSRALVAFTILSSEWLFRVKKIGEVETATVLGKVERGLRQILPHNLSSLVTEALAPLIEKALGKEGRILFPLSPFSDEAPELRYYPLDEASRTYDPHHRVKARPGPCVWIAPWVAAVATDKLLKKKLKSRTIALDLANALLGRLATVDSNEYGKHAQRIKGKEFDRYCEQLKNQYARMLRLTADPTGNPEAILAGMLRSLGPAGILPLDETLVKTILMLYAPVQRPSRPKRGGAKAPARRQSWRSTPTVKRRTAERGSNRG
jgi:hypothetical protein